ncbi:MAG TPA: hypothetical protein PLT09_13545 [Deltaproteobacteria bacterium]|nr:hypothetical protein [Deltaproteobacteria bacterium]HPR55084.1 hypothetical protein [Deltaproteobacteria bacterium]HXK48467.1 hypothetical protein [Deltaproteobacteria bacterium]
MNRIIPLISIAVLALMGQPAMGDDIADDESLYGFLAGRYITIGKELNSDRTYCGKVVFSHEKGHLMVTRDIGGKISKGEGRIEHALGPDKADVLRVRFVQAGQEYEITYLWQSDLDNYARLSGYLYQPGRKTDSPGMEALFIDHTKR